MKFTSAGATITRDGQMVPVERFEFTRIEDEPGPPIAGVLFVPREPMVLTTTISRRMYRHLLHVMRMKIELPRPWKAAHARRYQRRR